MTGETHIEFSSRARSNTVRLGEGEDDNGAESRVLIIVTGGTFAMVNEGLLSALVPTSIAESLKNLEELQRPAMPACDILEWDTLYDSSDVGLNEWCLLCEQIKNNYTAYDGFVILHGTDSMAYTTSALSFMLENLGKPVIVTGAMLPLYHIRTDARNNLVVSVMIAGFSRITEVCLLFGCRLLRGNRVRKLDCSQFDAFNSPNFPPLGHVGIDVTCDEDLFRTPSKRAFKLFPHLCRNILVLKLTPGLSGNVLKHILSSTARPLGVVFELYGSGTFPRSDTEFVEAIKTAIQDGIEIAAVTQCTKGTCALTLYENGVYLWQLGVIECKDMTPEATFAKLSYLMGKGYQGAELRNLMESNIRGEISTKRGLMSGTLECVTRSPTSVSVATTATTTSTPTSVSQTPTSFCSEATLTESKNLTVPSPIVGVLSAEVQKQF